MQDFELFFMIPAMFFTQFSMIPAILGGYRLRNFAYPPDEET